MFGKTSEPAISRSQSLIQEGVTIRGDIHAEGDLRLEGSLEGSLVARAKVIVGATGSVNADVDAAEVLVMGKVIGRIAGHHRIELRKGAYVEGDLITQSLVIEEGVFFQGACQMPAQASGTSQEVDTPRGSSLGSPGDYTTPEDEEIYGRTGTKSAN
ncbi:MAG: polymer-forming cytoskeletal protein [Candidatus Eisenbacteria bacterium]|nr:polymer-forming cytoskeletal protein [Candidatus Eisenbacteria bacterium]